MKTKRRSKVAAEPADLLPDRTVVFHARISREASDLIRAGAAARHTRPSSYGRSLLYQALGLIKVAG